MREHIPDFFADTRTGRWLIDVRPAGRITPRDEVAFAATAEATSLLGWGYRVVPGWDSVAAAAVEVFSAQRRPLNDRLGMADTLLAAAEGGPSPFGELAAATIAPPVARAYLLYHSNECCTGSSDRALGQSSRSGELPPPSRSPVVASAQSPDRTTRVFPAGRRDRCIHCQRRKEKRADVIAVS